MTCEDTDTEAGGHVRNRGRDGVMKECLRHPELERLQRERGPANTLSLDLEPPEL